MSKRKHVPELVKELRVFHHYESADKLESLARQLIELEQALAHAADLNAKLHKSYDSMTDNSVQLSIEVERLRAQARAVGAGELAFPQGQCKDQVPPGKMES